MGATRFTIREAMKYLVFVFHFVFLFTATAQNSYLKELKVEGYSLVYFDPSPRVVNLGQGALGLEFPFFLDTLGFVLISIDSSGNVFSAKHIVQEDNDAALFFTFSYVYRSGRHVVNFRASHFPNITGGFAVVEGDEVWGRKTSNLLGGAVTRSYFVSDSQMITMSIINGRIGLASFDLNSRQELWSNVYKTFDSDTLFLETILSVSGFPNGDISLMTVRGDTKLVDLLRISPSGDIVKSVNLFQGDSLTFYGDMHTIDADGNVWVAGAKRVDYEVTEVYIIKLDEEYNFLWKRRLFAENFPYRTIDVVPSQDGNIVFTYVAQGNLPVIYGKITPDGELLWFKGFSFYWPVFEVLPDGTLYFLGQRKYYEDGTWEDAGIVSKTDENGDIADCPQYDACLELIPEYDVEIMPVEWESYPWYPLDDTLSFRIKDIEATLTPHCGSPPPPTPYFTLPDTICAGDCLSPDSIYNRLAHQVEWYISGPGGLDTTIVDTTFFWCFEEAGTYQIEQGVWLLG